MAGLICELCGAGILENDLMVIQDDIMGRKYVHEQCFNQRLGDLLAHKNELKDNMANIAHSAAVSNISYSVAGNTTLTSAFDDEAKKIGHFRYADTRDKLNKKLIKSLALIAMPVPAFLLWSLLQGTLLLLFLMFSPFMVLMGIGSIYDAAFLWWSLRDVRKGYGGV